MTAIIIAILVWAGVVWYCVQVGYTRHLGWVILVPAIIIIRAILRLPEALRKQQERSES